MDKPELECLEQRLVPTANPLETQVNNLYLMGLNRNPSPSGLAAHVAIFEKGASPGVVAAAIVNSPEHRENVVKNLFETYQNR